MPINAAKTPSLVLSAIIIAVMLIGVFGMAFTLILDLPFSPPLEKEFSAEAKTWKPMDPAWYNYVTTGEGLKCVVVHSDRHNSWGSCDWRDFEGLDL